MGEPFLLLIEENPDDVYLTLREIRRLEPYLRVEVISDSAEALSYLQESTDLPSAVLLGLKFIRLSGLELLAELRRLERTRNLPVILLTAGKEERERLGRALNKASATACVVKPVERRVLSSLLDRFGVCRPQALAS